MPFKTLKNETKKEYEFFKGCELPTDFRCHRPVIVGFVIFVFFPIKYCNFQLWASVKYSNDNNTIDMQLEVVSQKPEKLFHEMIL